MKQEIIDFATLKDIKFLLHFTKTDNIASIMRYGLVPVKKASEMGITPLNNDMNRLDYQPNASSLSIMFPNSRMFYKYRKANEAIDWAVLAINKSILWEKPCGFCQFNAADSRVTAISIDQRMTPAALSAMYTEIEGERSREEQKLRISDPTHDQAEVLVLDTIEPSYIVGAAFESEAARDKYASLLPDRKLIVNQKDKGFFASRSYNR